jgi:hypothetical protein
MSSNKKGNQGRESITDPSIAKSFEGKNFVFLATLMEDNSPQLSPTWVDINKNNNAFFDKHRKGSN